MDSKFLISTVAAGITLFVLGFLLYGLALASFFDSQATMEGVYNNPPNFVFLGLGELFAGALITLAVGSWLGAKDFAAGLKAGATFGILLGLGFGLTMYGVSNISTLTGWIADAVVQAVRFGVAGGVVGLVMGLGSDSE